MWGVSMLTHTVMAVDVGQLMADAGMTILTGVVVVFSVLILLTFIFWLFGKIAGGSSKKTLRRAQRQPRPFSAACLGYGRHIREYPAFLNIPLLKNGKD